MRESGPDGDREPTPGGLERWQVLLALAAVAAGAGVGLLGPAVGQRLGVALWPALAALLLVTFLQLPLGELGAALRQGRYFGALMLGNFAAVPLLVFGLSRLLPDDASLRLGFLLVLLAPCTDWFTTFTHLGRGDGRLALVSAPVLLLAQLALTPLFLVVFLGPQAADGLRAAPFLLAFAGILLAPLALAFGLRRLARRRRWIARTVAGSARSPLPLLALVLFLVASSEIGAVLDARSELLRAAALFVLYLLLVPFIAALLGRMLRLTPAPARTLVFSLATRNSFVVLPLVLAWPGAGALAAAVVVLQSLIELCGMLLYVQLVPRWIGRRRTEPG